MASLMEMDYAKNIYNCAIMYSSNSELFAKWTYYNDAKFLAVHNGAVAILKVKAIKRD